MCRKIVSIGILKGRRRNKAAILWEGEPGDKRTLTYQQLHREVCQFAQCSEAKQTSAKAIASSFICR